MVISATDLARIKNATVVKSKEDVLREKKTIQEQKNAQMEISKARKERMQKLD